MMRRSESRTTTDAAITRNTVSHGPDCPGAGTSIRPTVIHASHPSGNTGRARRWRRAYLAKWLASRRASLGAIIGRALVRPGDGVGMSSGEGRAHDRWGLVEEGSATIPRGSALWDRRPGHTAGMSHDRWHPDRRRLLKVRRAFHLVAVGARWLLVAVGSAVGAMVALASAAESLLYLVPAEACDSGCWRNDTLTRVVGVVGIFLAVAVALVVPVAAWLSRTRLRSSVLIVSGVAGSVIAWWVVAQHLLDSVVEI